MEPFCKQPPISCTHSDHRPVEKDTCASCNTYDVGADAMEKRRACGCLRTCDKVKALLDRFPSPPPPATEDCGGDTGENSWESGRVYNFMNNLRSTISKPCENVRNYMKRNDDPQDYSSSSMKDSSQAHRGCQHSTVLTEIGKLLQLSITASALILYYLIYCYMQLVYFTLSSAVYFHNADGPMKVTIAVVIISTILVGINLFVRLERVFGILF